MLSLRITCIFPLTLLVFSHVAHAQQPAQSTAVAPSSPATTQSAPSTKIGNAGFRQLKKQSTGQFSSPVRISAGQAQLLRSWAEELRTLSQKTKQEVSVELSAGNTAAANDKFVYGMKQGIPIADRVRQTSKKPQV